MPSKRSMTMQAKKQAKEDEQNKPSGGSKYGRKARYLLRESHRQHRQVFGFEYVFTKPWK